DTYEIENRPYFGYMRGRYTKAELKELDAYALKLGIELIPCIQMLGHLATHLKWGAAGKYKDTENALLVGSDETYRLIDDMLRTVNECFTTKRIHIGMDETHDLGTGKAIDEYGYREKRDLYFEHLQKVSEMCRSYGFIPMIWSDMFYKLTGKGLDKNHDYYVNAKLPDNIRELVPEEVQPVFWDYYATDEDVYLKSIDNHAGFAADTIFAGGIWTWNSYGLFASYLKTKTLPGLEACRKKGVKEVFATIWNSGGYTASMITSLAGLAWYASYDYNGGHDDDLVKECFRYSCGRDFSDFEKLELCEHLPDGCGYGGSMPLVFNDPLIGLLDRNIQGYDLGTHYRSISAQLSSIGDTGEFAPAFEVIKRLSSLLENKADFGVRLKAAYDAHDNKSLAALVRECDTIADKLTALCDAHEAEWMTYNKPFGFESLDIRYGAVIMRIRRAKSRIKQYLAGECDVIYDKLMALRDAHEAEWMTYNKPFGWESLDIRYGGSIMRIKQTKHRIMQYLAGEIESIEELEAVRLRYNGRRGYSQIATAARL
nr:beta-N-acetylhexosaminidase [Clostridia bacterium]